MKRIIIFLFLIVWIGLSACSNSENAAQTDEATTPSQAQEPVSETTAELAEPYIVSIIDRSEAEHLDVATAEEVFFEDDLNRYIFPNIISHHVIVTYSDGSSEPIIEALESGRACLADLDRFEIEYFTEEKHRNPNLLSIEDQSVAEITKDTPELFYEDESFRYYLPEGLADQILVTYTDGTSEPVEAALGSGRISTLDLDQFEISYTRIEKYMAVMQRDGKEEFPLPDEARQTVEEILSGQEWIDTVPNCRSDIILSTGLGYLEYHTACGTFTDHRNMICCTVTEEERLQLLELFSSIIPIP